MIGSAGSGAGQYGKPLGLATDRRREPLRLRPDQQPDRQVQQRRRLPDRLAAASTRPTIMLQGLADRRLGQRLRRRLRRQPDREVLRTGASLGQWGTAGSGNLQFQRPDRRRHRLERRRVRRGLRATTGSSSTAPAALAAPTVVTGPADDSRRDHRPADRDGQPAGNRHVLPLQVRHDGHLRLHHADH